MYKIGAKFHFCPWVKYAFHYTDFHEITTVQWYYGEIFCIWFYSNQSRNMEIMGSLCRALHAGGVSMYWISSIFTVFTVLLYKERLILLWFSVRNERNLVCRSDGQGSWTRKGNLLKHWSNDYIVHTHLNGIIQTRLTLIIYNTLSLQQPLEMWGTLFAEQAAKHARAFILVFAPYWRLLFALQQALSRWPMALWALYTNTWW